MVLVLVLVLGIVPRATASGGEGAALSGWSAYGGSNAGIRYSALREIDRETVGRLALAWTYRTGDVSDGNRAGAKSTFEATPILAFGKLYVCTPFNRVIALDPDTGRELWKHDPKIDLSAHYANDLVCRGVAAWSDGSAVDAGACRDRIITATNDARLISLDAATGQRCRGFGTEGVVDLATGVGQFEWSGEYQVTSAPLVLGDALVIGSAISDNWRVDAPSGVVRAFDARTGALRWWWNGSTTAEEDPDAFTRGTPNAWAPLSADAERGLVFVPTGNASPDFFGAYRGSKGDFASSVVALRAATGELVWHFQTVHHDVWDYDVSAQPALVDLRRNGELVPAVVQATKTGLLFVLDRETGRPVFPVEERPVPTNGVPGERLSPTQPFPVRPLPLVPHFLGPDDVWGLTPLDRAWCRRRLAELRSEGIFTPPTVGGSIEYPGIIGGVNWGSVAFDPDEQRLFANSSNVPYVIRLVPRSHYDIEAKRERSAKSDLRPQLGTPFGILREPFTSPLGVPCNEPPWGNLSAIDMASGEIRWTVPLGTIRDLTPLPLPLRWGVPSVGGPIATAGGLVFVAAALDDYLRAFDSDTGALLWEARLPAGGQATPMTYRASASDRQFVVVAAGGHGRAGTRLGDYLVAFALPRGGRGAGPMSAIETGWGLDFILWLQSVRGPLLEAYARAFHWLGYEDFFLLLLPFIYWAIDAPLGKRMFVLLIGSLWLNGWLKSWLARPRPFVVSAEVQPVVTDPSYGIPSGHAQNAVVLTAPLARQIRRHWFTALMVLYVLLISFSRMVAGVHFPQDVVVGLVLGIALFGAYAALERPVSERLRRAGLWAEIGFVLIAAAVMLVVHPVAFTSDPVWPSTGEGTLSAIGVLIGSGTGFALEARQVRFSASGAAWKRGMRTLIGLAGLLVLRSALDAAFESVEPAAVFRLIRYMVIGFWAAYGAPWVFVRAGLAGRRAPAA